MSRGTRRSGAGTAAASALVALAIACGGAASRADTAAGWRARVSAKLLEVYDAARRGAAAAAPGTTPAAPGASSSTGSPFTPHLDAAGRVQVDVHYDCAAKAPVAALTAAGLSVSATVDVPPLCVVEGWIAPAGLAGLASVAGVASVTMPTYALPPRPGAPAKPTDRSAPRELPRGKLQSQGVQGSAIDANGVTIMRADQFVEQTGTNGAGVTVGVQSTGVASLATIQQRGELPSVQVLTPSGQASPLLADEGTALLEEVHAVAPGAGLAFCGPETFVEYTSCLQQLIAAGATILVDDVIFLAQDPMSAANADTQAVQTILARNPSVALFTVVGNYNGSYWEGPYAPVSLASLGLPTLTCPTSGGTQTDSYVAELGSSTSAQLRVTAGSTFQMMFAWADPSAQNTSNFDVYWSNTADGTQSGCFSATGVSGNAITPSLTLNAGTYTLLIATPDASLAGKYLKLWLGGDGLTFLSPSTAGSIVSAQAFAPGAITIGAVKGSDGIGNQIESFSSLGPLSLFFPTPSQVPAPTLVAPDGIYVDAVDTYFEGTLFPDGNFYGTSASVPNAGAVAALLRADFPTLTVTQLVDALTAGAAQLGSSVPDGTFGSGRVDAMGALGTLPQPKLTPLPNSTIDAGASSQAYPFTVSGTGNLHFIVSSSDPSLVPATIAAAGMPGASIAPSGCGVSVWSCTITITAAPGAGGTTDMTLSAVDGANRGASVPMMITVKGPPPSSSGSASSAGSPPAASTAEPAAKGGGGAFGWAGLAALSLLAARRASLRRRAIRPASASTAD